MMVSDGEAIARMYLYRKLLNNIVKISSQCRSKLKIFITIINMVSGEHIVKKYKNIKTD